MPEKVATQHTAEVGSTLKVCLLKTTVMFFGTMLPTTTVIKPEKEKDFMKCST